MSETIQRESSIAPENKADFVASVEAVRATKELADAVNVPRGYVGYEDRVVFQPQSGSAVDIGDSEAAMHIDSRRQGQRSMQASRKSERTGRYTTDLSLYDSETGDIESGRWVGVSRPDGKGGTYKGSIEGERGVRAEAIINKRAARAIGGKLLAKAENAVDEYKRKQS